MEEIEIKVVTYVYFSLYLFHVFILVCNDLMVFFLIFLRNVSLVMEIFHGDYFECVPQEVVDEIPASFSDITFNYLRTFKFYDVLLEEVEMQLIKVLLAKSPAKMKMVIKTRQMETNKSLNILAEITKFQRASSKAEVLYLVH